MQDNIRVSRSLTVNLGLRWDPFVPYSDDLGRTECFVPGLTVAALPQRARRVPVRGRPGLPGRTAASLTGWQFGPRVGFAYNVGGDGHTTVRGGFGIFYQPPFVEAYNNMVDSAPFSPQVQRFGVNFANPYAGIANPFPAQFAP